MSLEELGCCGAYCRTCKVYHQKLCAGCKLGYADKTRDLAKAKCKIKVCCITKEYSSCADCTEYETCAVIQPFHNHDGYKYGKYKQAVAYIRDNGYETFFKIADGWDNACGKY